MTANTPGNRSAQSDSVRVIRWDRLRADQAFAVHANLLGLAELRPELKHNPFWTMTVQDAYERFALAFEEVGK